MHLLVLAIFGKYCIRDILCGHSKIDKIFKQYQRYVSKYFSNLTIFPRNISIILFKYFAAMWAYRCEFFEKPNKKNLQ